MESEYTYLLTETAENYLDRILDYIVYQLLNPSAAKIWQMNQRDVLTIGECKARRQSLIFRLFFILSTDPEKEIQRNKSLYYIDDSPAAATVGRRNFLRELPMQLQAYPVNQIHSLSTDGR
ncbi:MAG: hypothetical protein VZR23_05865 [Lachnospiraceae bacterium]|jgi:hypothetical protein|nr:hypothetical protein [Lachnospiraceae bacterium]